MMRFLSRNQWLNWIEALAPVIAACVIAAMVSGQQISASSVAGLLIQLGSDDSAVRSDAFTHLRSDPAALRDPKVKTALVRLLDRENQEPVEGEDEDFAEYTSWLADTVAKIVNWENPHEVCILADSIDLPDELGEHARVAFPCLLRRWKSGRNRYAPGPDRSRGSVVAILVQASAHGKGQLDASTKQTVRT
jgi:hypothetical protein